MEQAVRHLHIARSFIFMNIQSIIVGIIVLAALFYVARALFKSAKGHACESGKCGCGKPAVK